MFITRENKLAIVKKHLEDGVTLIVFDPSIRYQLGDACYDPVIN